MKNIRWVRAELHRDITRCVIVFVIITASVLWAVYGGPAWRS